MLSENTLLSKNTLLSENTLPKNIMQSNQRFISANATLSTISTTTNATTDTTITIDNKNIANKAETKVAIVKETIVQKTVKQETITKKSHKPTKHKQDNHKPSTNKTPISKLSIMAIGLTIGLGGFLSFYTYQQSALQQRTIVQLQSELSTLKQSITEDLKAHIADTADEHSKQLIALDQKVSHQINTQAQSQQHFITKVDDAIKVSEQNLFNFNERLSAISTTDNNTWLISQANYLVNLAGRKIWNDQDYITARLLLKSADTSLAQAPDPSLLPARQAINRDIATLAAISFTDFDGMVMTLMNLADGITELPLVDHYKDIDLGMANHDDTVAELAEINETIDESVQTTKSVSDKVSNWYDNLTKSTHSFVEKFIQVEKYDNFGECVANAGQDTQLLKKCQIHAAIIMPEQALYLRENIKLRLFIAAQAVPRHQELIYQQALNDVAIWVNAYFDHNTSSVKAFLNELANLQSQTISHQNLPQQLSSRDELDKLMQVRVRAMLAN